MTQQLEHSWVKEIFTPDELKQYAEFEKEMKSTGQQDAFTKHWDQLVEELTQNLGNNPYSKAGIELGRKYMDWVNGIYGKKYAHLRTKKWEQGFGEGKGLDEVGLTPELMAWIEKAVDAYWRDRIYGLLNQVGSLSSSSMLKQWHDILDEMYGNEEARKRAIYEAAFLDEKVSDRAKAWLKEIFKS